MRVYVLQSDWYPHNSDSGCDCEVYESMDKAKRAIQREVEDYIKEMTKIEENGYQYCEGMEYVNWNEDMTDCSLCTDREDYVNWEILERNIK